MFINFKQHLKCLLLLLLLIVTSITAFSNNLPIQEFPAESNRDYFVLFLSGDGGWKAIDQSIATNLNNKKVPVLAINTMKYLWSEKTPLQIAKDLEWLMNNYMTKWRKNYVVVMGYSMGAEVLPFVLNQTNVFYINKIKDLILIAPAQKAIFKIKMKNYLVDSNEGQEVLPELKKLKITRKYCICDDNKYSLCKKELNGTIEYDVLKGGHHFDGDYSALNVLLNKRLSL